MFNFYFVNTSLSNGLLEFLTAFGTCAAATVAAFALRSQAKANKKAGEDFTKIFDQLYAQRLEMKRDIALQKHKMRLDLLPILVINSNNLSEFYLKTTANDILKIEFSLTDNSFTIDASKKDLMHGSTLNVTVHSKAQPHQHVQYNGKVNVNYWDKANNHYQATIMFGLHWIIEHWIYPNESVEAKAID